MSSDHLTKEVIAILGQIDRNKSVILPRTLILSELDFDSLQMMSLFEILMDRFGVDLMSSPYTLNDIRTPESIASAVHSHLLEN